MRALFVFAFLLFPFLMLAQLSGTVRDDLDGRPIPHVNVFLNGTSYHTVTDEKGHFLLDVPGYISTELIFNHLSYIEHTIADPFNADISQVLMSVKDNLLQEVVTPPDRFSRKDKLKAFRTFFLGNTKAAKECVIRNEKDIMLKFIDDGHRFTAVSLDPIIIDNPYLGYELHFNLSDFLVIFSSNSLKESKSVEILCEGTCFFIDKQPGVARYEKRRRDIYLSSSAHFFRSLLTNGTELSQYEIRAAGFPSPGIVKPYDYFSVQDTLHWKRISIDTIASEKKISFLRENNKATPFEDAKTYGAVELHEKKGRSGMLFLSESFLVDTYGNLLSTDDVVLAGKMLEQNIGAILPLNYQPPKSKQ